MDATVESKFCSSLNHPHYLVPFIPCPSNPPPPTCLTQCLFMSVLSLYLLSLTHTLPQSLCLCLCLSLSLSLILSLSLSLPPLPLSLCLSPSLWLCLTLSFPISLSLAVSLPPGVANLCNSNHLLNAKLSIVLVPNLRWNTTRWLRLTLQTGAAVYINNINTGLRLGYSFLGLQAQRALSVSLAVSRHLDLIRATHSVRIVRLSTVSRLWKFPCARLSFWFTRSSRTGCSDCTP